MSFDQFTKEVLEPFTGKSICVCDKESGATLSELQIEKVTETESGEFDSLSVILKGNPEVQLPQNTYTFKSEAFDEVELFMVPNSVDSYQIIVSRKNPDCSGDDLIPGISYGEIIMSDPFIGEIMMWGFKFAPVHYAKCDGQPLEISQYNALFALVYNTFGGDGRVNFQLPDLRGRAPMHIGYGIDIGDKYGFESVVLTEANTGHRHLVTASANQAEEITPFDTHSGAGNFPAVAQGVDLYGVPSGTVALAPDALTSTGGNKSHSNMQPSLVINFCIALEGVFPSRS